MRGNTSRRALLPLFLAGLAVAAVTFAITSRRRRETERLEAIFSSAELAPVAMPLAQRRRVPYLAYGAYLLVLSLALALAPLSTRANAQSAADSESDAEAEAAARPQSLLDVGLCQSLEFPDPSCDTAVQKSLGPVTAFDPASQRQVVALPSPTPTPVRRPSPEPVATPVYRSAPIYVMSVPNGTVIHGIATWYGIVDGFTSDDTMADGNQFDPYDPTITASNSFPFGTWLNVCHDGRCINVCVHDRGAFTHALDLSMGAFAALAPLSNGVIDVTIQVISSP